MVLHLPLIGDTPRRTATPRGGLLSIPRPARAFLLLVELCAVGLTVGLLLTERLASETVLRFAVLAVLTIGYGELAARSERMKQYLGNERVAANPLSVWSFAAVLVMPAGWAAAFVVVQYAHSMRQARRDHSGRPYRLVFSAAVAMLAQLAAAAVLGIGAARGVLHGDFASSVAVVGAVVVFSALNFAILLAGMWLTVRPPSIRAMLPDHDAVGYELATLVLGIAAAEFLLRSPVLIPLMLVLVAYVHRSSVVKVLQHASRTDAKTGLLNAPAWNEHAGAVLSRSRRSGSDVAVLVIDMDRFKPINDTHGHLVGDQVLLAVAACLRRELRGHDGLGRFGGDEFVVILDQLDLASVELVGNRLREAIGSLHVADGLEISASIGLAHASAVAEPADLHELLEQADTALYAAKSAGRDQVCTAAR